MYEDNKISTEAITQLAQLHKEGQKQLPTPTKEVLLSFRRAFAAMHYGLVWEDTNARTAYYYGNYNGYDVIYYLPVGADPDYTGTPTIGKESIEINLNGMLFAYQNREITTPSALYKSGVLNDEAINAIVKNSQQHN